MNKKNLLIFGLGYSARYFVREYKDRFDSITGTTRSAPKQNQLREEGFNAILFNDDAHDENALFEKIHAATHILISVAPDNSGDPVLAQLGDAIKTAPHLNALVYLSTVGVYGDHDCNWVDETTTCLPVSKRSTERVVAEQQWREFADTNKISLAILRLAGIYGPGRNAFVSMEKGKSRRLVKKGQVFNRIHVADIAQATANAFEKHANGIFNVSDDEPAPPQDVVTYAHELAKRTPPPEQDFETAELSPMAHSFYGECKKVSNAKSKSELGMNYQWPNYKMALEKMWREDLWRSE